MHASIRRGGPLRAAAGLVALAALTTLAVPGCGDDTETTEGEGLAFEQFAETYRQAQCERAVTCGYMPDVDTCYGALAQDFAIAQAVSAVAFGDLTYDPKAAETCISTVTGAGCEGFSLFTPAILETCDAVFGNRRGEGQACVAATQCSGLGSVCEGSCGDGCCPGVCRGVEAAGQEGDACSEIAPCGDGLRCLHDSETETAQCLKLAGANQTCSPNGCIDGYACDPGNSKCFQQSATGADCNPALGEACSSLNEYCDGEQKKCIPLPRPGEPCGVNPIADYYCARMGVCQDGTCVARPGVGAECLSESVCLGQLECSGEPDFICGSLPSPSICTNFE